jgi:hypothetical protein
MDGWWLMQCSSETFVLHGEEGTIFSEVAQNHTSTSLQIIFQFFECVNEQNE